MTQDHVESETVYCFFDTNILMHFTTFDEVDWLTFLNARQVYLTLTMTVLKELNKHKDDNRHSWRQKRARTLLSKLDKILPETTSGMPVTVKDGVCLLEIPKEPTVEWSELELDPQEQDDRILASILQFKNQHPGSRVCFLSNDAPARRKAIYQGISVIKPDGKYLFELEQLSDDATRIRELQRENQELKNRIPKFQFGFDDTNGLLTITTTRPAQATDGQNVKILSEVFTDEYVPKQVIQQRQHFEHIINSSKGSTSEQQIQTFTKEYKEYLEKLEPALRRKWMSEFGQMCCLAFVLKNVGTAPANDLKIELHFPLCTLAIDAEDAEEEVDIPEEPHPSWMSASPGWLGIGNVHLGTLRISNNIFAMHSNPITHLIRLQSESQPRRRGPMCNETRNSHIVSYLAPKLLAEEIWNMQPVVVYLYPDGKRGFSIHYSISAYELTGKSKGTLHVQWK